MPVLTQQHAGDGAEAWPFRGLAVAATLLLPLVMPYSRAIGDGLLSVTTILFLIGHCNRRELDWLRTPWTRLALLLWGWMLLCTLISATWQAVLQAALALRFFVFAAALENWILADKLTRKRLWYVTLAVALGILIESWQQYLFGVNIFGYPRWPDGALTGPFRGPTAGTTYLMVFFPAFLPLCLLLLERKNRSDRLFGVSILVIAVVTMVLVGQRMPTLLLALGLCSSALLFRRFRLPVLLTITLCGVLLALTPIISPPTFAKLVVHFGQQIQHFWATDYGLIFARAVTMIQAHPWLGLGWDGYRNGCMQPEYLTGVSWLPVSDPASIRGCNIHPHNYWLQIATNCGLPGMLLFGALVASWLSRMSGGKGYLGNNWRAALLIIVFVAMWPIASATSLFTMPNAGWVFLMVGWGLAEARYERQENSA
jgi:O-antigen ligase